MGIVLCNTICVRDDSRGNELRSKRITVMEVKHSDDHRSFRLDCDCHHPLHFIKFDWVRWSDKSGDFSIDLFFCSERIGGFWKRVGRALKYVFGSQDLVTGDIVVSKEKAMELAAFLKEVSE